MNYNGINFLIIGNKENGVVIPPLELFSKIDPKGKIKLSEELYDLEEEVDVYKKKLVTLYDDLIERYATKKLDGEDKPIKSPSGKSQYVLEDTVENGSVTQRPKIEDRMGYDRDLKELFELEVPFKSKLSPSLLDGVVQIGRLEYRWLRELDLLKK